MYNNKSILITGGTGTLGKAIIKKLLSDYKEINCIIVYSRDEYKQSLLRDKWIEYQDKLFFVIGDIRDASRLQEVGPVDFIIHAAALKQVETCENNPYEAVLTNVIGTKNVIDFAIKNNVSKTIFISSDKAVHPISNYGATKLTAEKLILNANQKGSSIFSVVRLGNIYDSRGSVVEIFKKNAKNKVLEVHHPEAERFFITKRDAAEFCINSIDNMVGGKIFIPNIPSKKIMDIAKEICPNCEIKITALKPGNKIKEELSISGEEIIR